MAANAESLIAQRTSAGYLRPSASCTTEALALHVLPDLGRFYIDQIRDHDLEAWLVKARKEARDRSYSPHTINGWWRVLKMVLQNAARVHRLPDPTAGVKPLPLPQREHENSVTPQELRTFLDVTKRLYPQWHTFTVLGFTLGMRPGELRPLRWGDDVDLDAGTLTIRRSQRLRYVGPTKTKRIRVLALPTVLVDLLGAHREAMKGSAGFGHSAFPMVGGTGRVGAIGTRRLQTFASAIGIPARKPTCFAGTSDRSVGSHGSAAPVKSPYSSRRRPWRCFRSAGMKCGALGRPVILSFRRRPAASWRPHAWTSPS